MKSKQLLGLAVLLACTRLLTAQSMPYQFSYWTENFVPLTSSTVVPASQAWGNTYCVVPLGFTFVLGDQSYQTVQLNAFEGGLFENYDFDNGEHAKGIFGYNTATGLDGNSNSKVAYRTVGNAPNRIFKAEWLRVGFSGAPGEVSFQIWLFETSNLVQLHLGEQQVPFPESTFWNGKSPLAGMALDYHFLPNDNLSIAYSQWLHGPVTSPVDTILYDWMATPGEGAPQFGTDGIPSKNTAFTFTPASVTGQHSPAVASSLEFFPNPAVDKIRFAGDAPIQQATVQLLDLQGRLLFSRELPAGSSDFDLPATLEPGTYILRRMTDGKIATGKLIVG